MNKIEKILYDYKVNYKQLIENDLIEKEYFYYNVYAVVGENDKNHVHISFKFKKNVNETITKLTDNYYKFKFYKSKICYDATFAIVFGNGYQRASSSTSSYCTSDKNYKKNKYRQDINFYINKMWDKLNIFKYELVGEFDFNEFHEIFNQFDLYIKKKYPELEKKIGKASFVFD